MKRPFRSFLAPLFEEFILSRQSTGQWCATYYENLHYFDDHLARNYPDADILTDPMTRWCNPRPTENGNSCRVRTTVVWNFVDYARKRGWTTAKTRRDGINAPCSYIPHYFTQEKLFSFFNECDNRMISLSLRQRSLHNKLNRLELPVFFRLLLSSGMRTCEARWLKCRNVDLESGVKELMGHSILQSTMIYQDVTEEQKRAAIEPLEDTTTKSMKKKWKFPENKGLAAIFGIEV